MFEYIFVLLKIRSESRQTLKDRGNIPVSRQFFLFECRALYRLLKAPWQLYSCTLANQLLCIGNNANISWLRAVSTTCYPAGCISGSAETSLNSPTETEDVKTTSRWTSEETTRASDIMRTTRVYEGCFFFPHVHRLLLLLLLLWRFLVTSPQAVKFERFASARTYSRRSKSTSEAKTRR